LKKQPKLRVVESPNSTNTKSETLHMAAKQTHN